MPDLSKNPLVCAVCQDYFNEPCLMQCFHTFCARCLRGREQDGRVACPLCGYVRARNRHCDRPIPLCVPGRWRCWRTGASCPRRTRWCASSWIYRTARTRRAPTATSATGRTCITATHAVLSLCIFVAFCCFFSVRFVLFGLFFLRRWCVRLIVGFAGQALCTHCRENTHRAKMFASHEIMHMSKCVREPRRVRRRSCSRRSVFNKSNVISDGYLSESLQIRFSFFVRLFGSDRTVGIFIKTK